MGEVFIERLVWWTPSAGVEVAPRVVQSVVLCVETRCAQGTRSIIRYRWTDWRTGRPLTRAPGILWGCVSRGVDAKRYLVRVSESGWVPSR